MQNVEEKIFNTSILTKGFDKFKTNIPPEFFIQTKDIPSKANLLGLNYLLNSKGFGFEISGKPFATATTLGSIPLNSSLPKKIEDMTGIIIDEDYLFNSAPIFRIDPFIDVIVEDEPINYLSEMQSTTNE